MKSWKHLCWVAVGVMVCALAIANHAGTVSPSIQFAPDDVQTPDWGARIMTPRDAEVERAHIRAHLARVETAMRTADVAGYSAARGAARAQLLDALHEYRHRGVFPHNHGVAGRVRRCSSMNMGPIAPSAT